MKNSCSSNGYVVGLGHPLPTDPCDYDVGWNIGRVGCNNLHCHRCNIPVRNAPRLRLSSAGQSDSADSAKILYELPDISASPLVEASAIDRLYLCRCSTLEEVSCRSLDASDPIPSDPNVPWFCASHPVVTLPHDFDGARAESEADLREMCKNSLRGLVPPGAQPSDRTGADWSTRLYGRLAGTPFQDAVVAAAAALLDDPDPLICARAIHFIDNLQAPTGMERGVELLENKRVQFTGVPDPITDTPGCKTLEDSLIAMILPLARKPGPAQALIRADALMTGRGGYLSYSVLAKFDAEWLVAHAEEIAHAAPQHVKDLLNSLGKVSKEINVRPIIEKLRALLPKTDQKRR